MKELIVVAVALGALAVAGSAPAASTLTISDGGATNTVISPTGVVNYQNSSFDSAWSVVIVTGATKPALGSACNPSMDLNIQATSLTLLPPHNLIITFSDNSFGPSPPSFQATLNGHVTSGTGQTITYNTYYNANNATGAETTLLTASGFLSPPNYAASNTSGTINGCLYSLTQVVTIGGAGAAAGCSYSLDATLIGAANPPLFASVPMGGSLGCNPANAALPAAASVKAQVMASGNCGLPATNVTHLDGGTACASNRTFTITLTDACGNTNSTNVVYTWTADTTPPTLTCASNLTVSGGQAWSFSPPTASDACCTNLTIIVLNTVTNVSFNPCEINYTRTWQATDCCSNMATCSQTVTVIPTAPCQVFHTGMNGTTALLGGALDPNFVLISVPTTPTGAGTSALVMDPSDIPGSYLAEGPNSQWIGPNEFGQDQPEGVYHYQVTFLLCCTNGAEVSGQVAMDNTGGVYLNNNTQVASIAGSSAWSYWTQFTANSGFVPGLNTLDIYVTNNGSTEDPGKSQTGMRAEVTNCISPFLVVCSSNKTVGYCSNWTFDQPTALSWRGMQEG